MSNCSARVVADDVAGRVAGDLARRRGRCARARRRRHGCSPRAGTSPSGFTGRCTGSDMAGYRPFHCGRPLLGEGARGTRRSPRSPMRWAWVMASSSMARGQAHVLLLGQQRLGRRRRPAWGRRPGAGRGPAPRPSAASGSTTRLARPMRRAPLGVDRLAEQQDLRGPAEPDDAGQQVGGAHVAAGQPDVGEQEAERRRRRHAPGGPRPGRSPHRRRRRCR